MEPAKCFVEASHNRREVAWELVANQEGQPVEDILDFDQKTFHVVGDFAGAVVEIRGFIVPNEFDPLTDYEAIPLSFDHRGIKSSDDRVRALKPVVVGGTSDTKLRVHGSICR